MFRPRDRSMFDSAVVTTDASSWKRSVRAHIVELRNEEDVRYVR